MRTFKILSIIIGVFLITLNSCTSRKKILYLQNQIGDSTMVYADTASNYRLSQGDVLYVNVISMNKPLSEMFNRIQSNSTYANWNSESNIYINGYSVNDSGKISIPIIGDILVNNLTLNDAKVKIETEIRQYVSDANVIVKLLNFRYSVIGEVLRPGTYKNFDDNLTIFQALAEAGDVTIFGDKKAAKIIRQLENGQTQVIEFDLTQAQIINSNVYKIKPNDVIYIKPVRNKSFRQNLPNIALIFSSISTVILVLNYIGK